MAELRRDARGTSNDAMPCDASKKEEPADVMDDEFEKRWADIEYLIRKPFCCK